MTTLSKAFAERTMELMIKHDKSKYRLEKDTGINHSTLIKIFKDGQKDVKLSTIAKVAKVFNMTLGEFLTSKHFDLKNIDLE